MGARRAKNVVFGQCFISKCLLVIQSFARLNQLYQVVGALNQKCNGFPILRTLITFNLNDFTFSVQATNWNKHQTKARIDILKLSYKAYPYDMRMAIKTMSITLCFTRRQRGWVHTFLSQACFLLFGPPNLRLSLQLTHVPQSSPVQPAHVPHRFPRERWDTTCCSPEMP